MVEGSVSQATTFESAPRTAFATSRRGLILAATTLALLLTGAATAFACIVAQGGMTLTNPATGESETVIGDPGDGSKFMKWCEGSEDAVTVQKGSRVEISVTDAGSGSSNCGEDIDSSNQLPDGEYVVTFTNNGFSGSGPYDDGDLN